MFLKIPAGRGRHARYPDSAVDQSAVWIEPVLINGMAKDVPMAETYKGVLGFCVMDVIRLALLIAFPMIVLWLLGLK